MIANPKESGKKQKPRMVEEQQPPSPDPTTDLLEKLAELEHEQWKEWASHLSKTEELSDERLRRWNRLYVPYSELSEESKEQDRIRARKSLALIDTALKERDARLAERLDKIRLELCISHKANEKTTTGKKDCKERNWHWNADLYNIVAELDRSEAKQE